MAGLPPEVLDRAKEILRTLEENELDPSGKPRLAKKTAAARPLKA